MTKNTSGSLMAALLILCTVAALWPSTAKAQVYVDLVWEQLKAVQEVAAAGGYGTQNYIIGNLSEGQSDAWTITLYGGYDYMILAACDGDCQDLDIRLYDANGNVIDSDTTEDSVPTITGTVAETARFTIEVDMYECSSGPCYFGFGVFGRAY